MTTIPTSPNLIINADDFGVNHSVNTAIAASFSKGIINSASMIVTMPGFEEALELSAKYGFRDKLGIHINLTEGFPLTNLSKTGLLDLEGKFSRKAITNPYIYFSAYVKKKIKEELKQQYRMMVDNGIRPTHINSHHHVHTLPWLSAIFLDFAKKEDLKIRIAQSQKGKSVLKHQYRMFLNNQFKKKQLHFSDHFENAVFLVDYLDKIKDHNVVFEVMVHPAYQKDVIIDLFSKVNLEELVNKIKVFFHKNAKAGVLAAFGSTALT
jgi:predicted glycoside hydrolase/deacetylase ChbG (UPF0249 family)